VRRQLLGFPDNPQLPNRAKNETSWRFEGVRQHGCELGGVFLLRLGHISRSVHTALTEDAFRLQCEVDTDCGPAAFVCRHGPCGEWIDGVEVPDCRLCQQTGGGPCSIDADCPQGWSCHSPCFCPTNPSYSKGCYPPFSVFSCPGCAVEIVDGG